MIFGPLTSTREIKQYLGPPLKSAAGSQLKQFVISLTRQRGKGLILCIIARSLHVIFDINEAAYDGGINAQSVSMPVKNHWSCRAFSPKSRRFPASREESNVVHYYMVKNARQSLLGASA